MNGEMVTAPGNVRENDVELVKAADAKARAAVVSTVGGQAPEAKILPSTADVVLSAIAGTVGKLTDGEVPIETTTSKTADGRLAPEAFTALVGWQGMIAGLIKQGVVEAKPYEIDAKAAAADGNKLIEVASLISEAQNDKALLAAVRRAGGSAKPAKVEPAKPAEKPDMALDMARTMLDRRDK